MNINKDLWGSLDTKLKHTLRYNTGTNIVLESEQRVTSKSPHFMLGNLTF